MRSARSSSGRTLGITCAPWGLLHAELDGERCRCGKARRSCPEAAIVDGVHGSRAWEARQKEEARGGRRHYLPDGHPALVDHRWHSKADPEGWLASQDGG